MTDEPTQRLELLILARLSTTTRRPPSVKKLEDELLPFVEARLSRGEWSSQLARRLDALRTKGALDARRVPTSKGLERLRVALGVRELPERWPEFTRALIPALALALPGAQWSELSSADMLRARIIRQHRRLPLPELPTLAQAVDAQIWQALGLDEKGPLTLGTLRRAVLERTLGISLRAKSIDVDEVAQRLTSAATGTSTTSILASQRALVGRWLLGTEAPRTRTDEPPRTPPATIEPTRSHEPPRSHEPTRSHEPPPKPLPLERWAQQVQALADAASSGRYGDERVFIATVWHAAQAGPAALHGPLSAFKARLVEANRAGLLRLHRADLVGAMDPTLVRESETQHLNATFHFVESHPRRAS